jgi:hypothetical protein
LPPDEYTDIAKKISEILQSGGDEESIFRCLKTYRVRSMMLDPNDEIDHLTARKLVNLSS